MLQVLFQSSADSLSVVWHTGDNLFLEPSLFLEPDMFPQRLVAGVDGAGLFQFIWTHRHSDHSVSAHVLRDFAADYMYCSGPLQQS